MLDAFGVKNETNSILNALGLKTKNPYFLTPWCYDLLSLNLQDPLVIAIWKYENYPSIIKIKSSVEKGQLFNFNFVNGDISKTINSLDALKKTNGAVPTKIAKLANKQVCKDMVNCINECIKQKQITTIADITPIF